MRRVLYKKIMIEGFQSFGEKLVFNLDRVGINLIKGVNGTGKSTIFNAILWCEYGGNLKKSIETWEENRTSNYKGTRVVVERTDGEFDYRIVRHLNYKGTTFGLKGGDKLMIYKKSVSEEAFTQEHLVGDGLHKSDMQKIINEQLGMDEKTYLNSILFGQRVQSLIQTPNADKRKLFEELFDLAFVDKAKEVAQTKQTALNSSYTVLSSKLDNAEHTLSNAKETLEEQEGILKEFKDNQKQRVKDAQKVVDDLENEISEVPKKTATLKKELAKYDLKVIEDKAEALTELQNTFTTKSNDLRGKNGKVSMTQTEIENSNTKILRLEQDLKDVDDTCPYCKQDLPSDKVKSVKDEIKSKITKEKEVISTLKKSLDTLKKSADELGKEVVKLEADVEDKRNELSTLRSNSQRAFEINTELIALSKDLANLEKRKSDADAVLTKEKEAKEPKIDLEKYRQIIADTEELIKTGSGDLDVMAKDLDRIDWWIKKGFGAGGLKSFVFNAMLNQLNIYAQRYAQRLGFRVEFSIDMSKASKPFQTLVYKGGAIKDYEDLSGGQKQRVDICVAFAMHDLIGHKADINILVMDEVFEGLDNAGIEAAFDLIRQKAENKSLYLITHSDIIDSLNCKSISLDLDQNGNSYISA